MLALTMCCCYCCLFWQCIAVCCCSPSLVLTPVIHCTLPYFAVHSLHSPTFPSLITLLNLNSDRKHRLMRYGEYVRLLPCMQISLTHRLKLDDACQNWWTEQVKMKVTKKCAYSKHDYTRQVTSRVVPHDLSVVFFIKLNKKRKIPHSANSL